MSCTLNAQHGGTAGLKLQKHQTEAKFRTAGAAATRLKRILQQQRSQNKQNRCAFFRWAGEVMASQQEG